MNSSKLIRMMVLGLLLGFFVAGMTILTSNTKKQVPPTELQEDNERNLYEKKPSVDFPAANENDLQTYLIKHFDYIDGRYYRKGLKPEDVENFTYGPKMKPASQFDSTFTYEDYKN